MKQPVRIMGIVNLTGDSFYPPSRMLGADGRLDRALFLGRCRQMASEGASFLDLGACSTRPGSEPVSEAEEWDRLSPALEALREEAPELLPRLSVDTFRGGIVRRVFDTVGPVLVNDISLGQLDADMLPAVSALGLPYVAMHMRGTPATMDSLCDYGGDVVGAVHAYFEGFAELADAMGIREWILDPGLGFAKTPEQCLELLVHLPAFADLGRPILIGLSRKRLVRAVSEGLPLPASAYGANASAADVSGVDVSGANASAADFSEVDVSGADVSGANASAAGAMDIAMARLHRLAIAGGASILRVHDVAAARACL